jgi:hypothetical protein
VKSEKETPFQRWYRLRKDEFNAKRRKRYKQDKAYREAQVAASANYRASRRKQEE